IAIGYQPDHKDQPTLISGLFTSGCGSGVHPQSVTNNNKVLTIRFIRNENQNEMLRYGFQASASINTTERRQDTNLLKS
ncbi:MAG: hypothetical protein KJ630_16890, partial [Proteobacteria bacterium]|nr:hypothetical protein [Pseudomonadota bacterium]